MDIDIFYTSLTFHEATPMKLAFASLFDSRFLRIVSSTATEEIATIHAGRGSIA